MLTKLENINKKSFDNYTLSSNLGEVNVFFGINGAGKTAISEYIQEHENRVMVFDSKFVQDNILLENREEIRGVELTTGKKEKEDKEKIRQIAQQLEEEYKKLHNTKVQKNKANNQLYLILNATLNKAKQQFKTNKIKQKPHARENPIQAYKLWQNDRLSGDLSHDAGLSSYDSIQEKIENLQNKQRELLKINFSYTENDTKELSYLLATSVIKPKEYEDKNFYDLLKWLEYGLSLHQLDNNTNPTFKCLFCESVVSTTKVENRIKNLVKNNYSNFESSIHNINEHLHKDLDMISHIPKELINQDVRKSLTEIGSDLEGLIDNKLKCPNKTINAANLNELDKLINSLMQIVSKKQKEINSGLAEYRTYLVKIEQIAKAWIGEQLVNDTSAKDYINQIENANVQIQAIEVNIDKLNKQSKEISDNHSDLKPFQDICNQKFLTLGLNLKLSINKGKNGYILSRRDLSELKVEDLSEGEQRLIGFLVFYFNVHLTKKQLNPDVDCIVFDDPITSLDDQNKLDVIEMINDMIREKFDEKSDVNQIFVLTNSSYLFSSIGYVLRKNISFFRITKDEQSNSQINKIPIGSPELKNRSTLYRSYFQSILEFGLIKREQLENLENTEKFCNQTRIVLESFIYSNYAIGYATAKNLPEIKEVFEINDSQSSRLKDDLDIINAFSHGSSYYDNIDYSNPKRRIQTAVKDIISILYLRDKNHVKSMINSNMGRDIHTVIQTIDNWSKNWNKI